MLRYEKIYYAGIEEKRDISWDSVLVNPESGSTYLSPRSSPDIIKIILHYIKQITIIFHYSTDSMKIYSKIERYEKKNSRYDDNFLRLYPFRNTSPIFYP